MHRESLTPLEPHELLACDWVLSCTEEVSLSPSSCCFHIYKKKRESEAAQNKVEVYLWLVKLRQSWGWQSSYSCSDEKQIKLTIWTLMSFNWSEIQHFAKTKRSSVLVSTFSKQQSRSWGRSPGFTEQIKLHSESTPCLCVCLMQRRLMWRTKRTGWSLLYCIITAGVFIN